MTDHVAQSDVSRKIAGPVRYADLFKVFSPEEVTLICQLKRFFECYEGDTEFRTAVLSGTFTEQQRDLMREIGITFDLDDLSLLWKRRDVFEAVLMQVATHPTEELSPDLLEPLKVCPLLHLWLRFNLAKGQLHNRQKLFCITAPSRSPEYSAWRQRRLAATRSELGFYGYNIDHPSLAIELANGCSVGCYFCAFDAPRLDQVYDYNDPKNLELFRGVARSLEEVLGWSAGHALLYWSTEPHDNPHYIDFLREYEKVTGATLCTATARFDEEWVRDLIAFYRRGPVPWPRISVLTKKIMYRLHKQFSPEEFRDLTMLMQQKDSEEFRTKVPGGRDKMLSRLDDHTDLRDMDVDERPDDHFAPQGSIACVSGFLINLINRSIRLISPCYTTVEYRHGYRIFDEATFEDAADFDRVLKEMVARKMVMAPYPAMPMRFRDDLRYRAKPDGFHVTSPNTVHRFTGNEIYGPLGEMLHRGTMTYAQVCDALVDEHRCNPLLVPVVIRRLFDRGFLDELDVVAPQDQAEKSKMREAETALA